ncbi:hypothetical protein AGLY_007809 [Aphis glycines]|uniref:Ferrochelatase, mitochondrial n=1 Tax=Aphis glycines TaxID=307491 RepID=A0A6G0TN88_APHGL|nr:hypothetical protein AGLY_007809 [Aphis glycines]
MHEKPLSFFILSLENYWSIVCILRKIKMFSSLKYLSKPTSDLTSRFMSSQVKTAVVMLNMGGPQHVDQVHGYLHRIMTDRDMMQLPFQNTLGPYIARRRTSEVQKKYAEIGGGSPILKWTNIQGKLMCEKLDKISPSTAPHKHYVAFRYVDPLTESTFEQVQKDGAERVVLFSQYPQYSCATSGSSFNAIYSYFQNKKFPENLKMSIIDRWATHPLLIKAIGSRISDEIKKFPESDRDDVVVLFSAHSLPLKAQFITQLSPYCCLYFLRLSPTLFPIFRITFITYNHLFFFYLNKIILLNLIINYTSNTYSMLNVDCDLLSTNIRAVNRGDAYPSEVSSTVHAVMEELGYAYPYALVWQSKVGPLPWLGPFTDDALKGYVKQGKKNFILVPIAFVNEHIETLHELDIEYCKELGEELGVKNIRRAAAPNDHSLFIDAIADIVSQHLRENKPVSPKFLLRCAHCISSRCYDSKQWFSKSKYTWCATVLKSIHLKRSSINGRWKFYSSIKFIYTRTIQILVLMPFFCFCFLLHKNQLIYKHVLLFKANMISVIALVWLISFRKFIMKNHRHSKFFLLYIYTHTQINILYTCTYKYSVFEMRNITCSYNKGNREHLNIGTVILGVFVVINYVIHT